MNSDAGLQIEISNYRAISADSPVQLSLDRGITFLLGRNNVGKSSILRLFSELRNAFPVAGDMRNRHDSTCDIAPFRWDAIAHRNGLDKPITVRFSCGKSRWFYVVEPHGKDMETTRMSVAFIPEAYAHDNDVAARVAKAFVKSLYFGPLRSTVYSGHNPVQNTVTGSNFISQWGQWAFGNSVVQQQATRKVELEIKRLFGFGEFNIQLNNDRNELFVEYDEGRYRLSELGEGLSHFIIVLGNALLKQPTYIFIDEPENGLHPKLQATFVQLLAEKCTHGLVATSHSMALARSVADRVLYCTKETGKGLVIGAHEHFSPKNVTAELLEMSYSQLIETGEQNLLLVEGRTDVKAMRELLKVYDMENRFVILPLGGSSMIQGDPAKCKEELAELRAIGAKSISIVIDSEKTSASAVLSQRHQGFQKICSDLGFQLFIMERRALENYVTQEALNAEQISAKAMAAYDTFTSTNGWDKNQNWKLFSRMKKSDFDGTDLGAIAQHLARLARI